MFASARLHPTVVILLALTLACEGSDFFATRVISDTIRLRSDGTGTISGIREAVPLQAGVPGDGPVYIASNIRFKVVGDQVEIEFVCPDAANCAPPPHLLARLGPAGLTARWGPHMSGRSPLLYEQVQASP